MEICLRTICRQVRFDGLAEPWCKARLTAGEFNTTANPTAQAELLELAAGDMIVIEENASRHQTITLTETPTLASGIVTVTGRTG